MKKTLLFAVAATALTLAGCKKDGKSGGDSAADQAAAAAQAPANSIEAKVNANFDAQAAAVAKDDVETYKQLFEEHEAWSNGLTANELKLYEDAVNKWMAAHPDAVSAIENFCDSHSEQL